MSLYDNDDSGARGAASDMARGHVALILAETILHTLVEKNLISTEDAVSALQTSAEVKLAVDSANAVSAEHTRVAIDALFQMMDSFAVDLDAEARTKTRSVWERYLRPE